MTTTATLIRSFPTFRWIVAPFRWIGRSRRRIWCAVSLLLAMIAAAPVWWATQLMGLPGIGHPFDIAEFRRFTIPDDRNAFILYRQAVDRFKPDEDFFKSSRNKVNLFARWSKADPKVRRWAEENREAMAIYRLGAERPDALDSIPSSDSEFSNRRVEVGELIWMNGPMSSSDSEYLRRRGALRSIRTLSLLEASRLEEQGDMTGAWGWYRAGLRFARHLGMHGTVKTRMEAQGWRRALQDRISVWAADPRITPALLRRALDDAIACESLAVSESFTLKAEYLNLDGLIAEPNGPGREVPIMSLRRLWNHPEYQLSPEQLQAFWDTWRYWRREPERSRRVIRLTFANWLAYYEMPSGDRPKPDRDAISGFDIYPLGSDAPAHARLLSSQSLDRWLNSTCDANVLLGYLVWKRLRGNERLDHRELLILLGTQLYRRDHGSDPPTPEALVGPYLKHLPEEFEGRDEAIPRSGKALESK